MVQAWIQLRCPSCQHDWEATPTELPSPETPFECPTCDERRSTAQFMRAQRDLEILKQFTS